MVRNAWVPVKQASFAHISGVRSRATYSPISGVKSRLLYALFDFDFSSLAVGPMSASTFLTNTGLAFSRTTVSTVQTSASALDSSAAIDDACIGDAGYGRGLVVQPNTKNLFATGSQRNWSSGWSTGSLVTVASSTGPDGTAATGDLTVLSGGYAPFSDNLTSSRYAASAWLRSSVADPQQMVWTTGAGGDSVVTAAGTTTWQRLSIAKGTASREYFTVCDCRDYSGTGGTTARNRHVIADFAQYELGNNFTEAVSSATMARTNDRPKLTAGSSVITSDGQIRAYFKLIPKFATASQVFYDNATSGALAAWYLFSWGANGQNYAKIKDSDKKLYVKIANGTELVSTNAVSFAAFDIVEFFVGIGSGVTSVAKYRVNGGSWTDLVLANVPDVPAPSGAISWLFNDNGGVTGDTGQFLCWWQRLTCYSAGEL